MGRTNKNASEDAFLGSTHPTDLRSFVLEPWQVGWGLARTWRHQHAFAAEEIILATDPNLVFVFAANRFQPFGSLADIFPLDGPWRSERIIDDRDLIVQEIAFGLVEIEALLDDGLAIAVKRHAA